MRADNTSMAIACVVIGACFLLFGFLVLTNFRGVTLSLFDRLTRLPGTGNWIKEDGPWTLRVGWFVGGTVVGVGLIVVGIRSGF